MFAGKKLKKRAVTGKLRVRRGDHVVVTTGKDRGAEGKVLRVLPAKGSVVVEGVNLIKRATRANPQKNIKGGILQKEAPIALSNVLLKDPESSKGTRVGIRSEGGERVRYAKRSKATISTVTEAAEG
jgi:large subunit ribosomal protein L24